MYLGGIGVLKIVASKILEFVLMAYWNVHSVHLCSVKFIFQFFDKLQLKKGNLE